MIKLFKTIILKIKIFITLNYTYSRDLKYKRIKSILSKKIVVGNDVVIEEDVNISNLINEIPDGVFIGKGTHIGACNRIGKYTSISFDVKIGLIAHPLNHISTSPIFYSKRRGWLSESIFNEIESGYTEIGNDVLISSDVTILAGVKIGNGAVIGAGSFVNANVPPYAIAVGSPAKVIKYRFNDEMIRLLQQSNWWDLPKDELLKFKNCFNNPEEFVKHIQTKN